MIETKILILRLTRRYTQKYMANQLDIWQESYSRIESGQQKIKPSEPLLPRIAKLLGVRIADLLNNQPIVVCTGDLIGTLQKQVLKDAEIAELKNQLAKKEAQIEKLLEMLLVARGGWVKGYKMDGIHGSKRFWWSLLVFIFCITTPFVNFSPSACPLFRQT